MKGFKKEVTIDGLPKILKSIIPQAGTREESKANEFQDQKLVDDRNLLFKSMASFFTNKKKNDEKNAILNN